MIEFFNITPTADSLEKKSSSILSVFEKTVNDLESLNMEASKQRAIKLAEIESARIEAERLDKITLSNEKIISKITSFLID